MFTYTAKTGVTVTSVNAPIADETLVQRLVSYYSYQISCIVKEFLPA